MEQWHRLWELTSKSCKIPRVDHLRFKIIYLPKAFEMEIVTPFVMLEKPVKSSYLVLSSIDEIHNATIFGMDLPSECFPKLLSWLNNEAKIEWRYDFYIGKKFNGTLKYDLPQTLAITVANHTLIRFLVDKKISYDTLYTRTLEKSGLQ